jgi:hypothetical protein
MSAATRLWIGETVTVTFTFTDPVTGAAVTPTGVTARARKPDGTTTTPSASVAGNVATVSVPADQSGNWWLRCTATGPSPSAEEVMFAVIGTNVP